MFIDMFGDIFGKDFERALELKPNKTPEQQASRKYLAGIARQSASREPDVGKITTLFNFLNQMDQRRGTDWSHTFPWLVQEFAKYSLTRN
jgi:hypothetical protein